MIVVGCVVVVVLVGGGDDGERHGLRYGGVNEGQT